MLSALSVRKALHKFNLLLLIEEYCLFFGSYIPHTHTHRQHEHTHTYVYNPLTLQVHLSGNQLQHHLLCCWLCTKVIADFV